MACTNNPGSNPEYLICGEDGLACRGKACPWGCWEEKQENAEVQMPKAKFSNSRVH